MYYICQLKDGYMFACVDKGVYKVVNTGYPYPDTPYPADVMLRNMLKALGISTVVKDLNVTAMQSLLKPYTNGVDIPASKLKGILTGKDTNPVGVTSSIFFKSKNIAVYYISNAKHCSYLRSLTSSETSRGSKLLKTLEEGVFLIAPTKGENKVRDLDIVERDTLMEFKQFNEGIQSYNLLKDGIDFYEEIVTGFESITGRGVQFKPCLVRMNGQSFRDMGKTILGYIYNILSYTVVEGDLARLITNTGKNVYGKYIAIKDPLKLPTSDTTSLTCRFENQIYLMVYGQHKFSKRTEEHLDRHVRSFLAYMYYRKLGSFSGLMDSYTVESDGVVLRGSGTFVCMKDFRNTSGRYKDFIDMMLERMSDKVSFVDGCTKIFIGDLLGSNFTSYEQRLFQYLIAYNCFFRFVGDAKRDTIKMGYSVTNPWVDRVMPFIYENYQKKYLFGGFEFSNSSQFLESKMNTIFRGFYDNRIENGIMIPYLFKELKLDDFNGRQLSDDEILFLHVFLFYFSQSISESQKEEDVYRVKLYKTFFRDKSSVKDNTVKLPKSILPVLKVFLKMHILASASSLYITSYNSILDDGSIALDSKVTCLGDLLFADGVINSLSDKNFKMIVGESYVSMIMYMKG